MKIALQLATLPGADTHKPRTRVSKLTQGPLPRGIELGVLLRQQRGRSGRLQKLGIFGELGVMADRRGRVSVSIDLRQPLAGLGGLENRAPVPDPITGAGAPETKPQSAVVGGLAQHPLQLAK